MAILPGWWRTLLLALAAAAVLVACADTDTPRDEAFRIGVVAPLSGPNQPITTRALSLAVDAANAQGGLLVGGKRLPVLLIPRDNLDRLEDTLVAVRELISRDRVTAIVGPYSSRQAIPAATLAQGSGVLLISPSSTNPETTQGKPLAFRVAFVDTVQGQALARFALRDLSARRAAVLYDAADEYCRGVAEYFRQSFEALGGEIGAFEAYLTGEKDFSVRMARIKAAKCQVLLLPNFPPDLGEQIRLAADTGAAPTLLGTDSWHRPETLALPGAQGAFFSTGFAPDSDHPLARDFVRDYRQRFGEAPNMDEALGFDALGLLFAAAQKAGSVQSAVLAQALASLGDFQGVTGTIRFTGSGDPQHSVVILRVQDGKPLFRKEIVPNE